jgi:hypothetical protein
MQHTRQQSIKAIRNAGDDEKGEGRAKASIQNSQHQKRNNAKPEKRQLIRSGAESVHRTKAKMTVPPDWGKLDVTRLRIRKTDTSLAPGLGSHYSSELSFSASASCF